MEVHSSCLSSRLLPVAMGASNRVALPGVAPVASLPPLWVRWPLGGPFSSPLLASKAALSRAQTGLSCPVNSYEFGREL